MLHSISTNNKTRKKRSGRGGSRGKLAGRGHKGQKSRAGRNIRPAIRDEMQRIPKRRGHNRNRARGVRADKVVRSVTLTMLEKNCKANDIITPNFLVQKKLISRVKGKPPKVKIVASGDITIPLTVRSSCSVTKGAEEKIAGAKGSVQ